MRVKISVFRDMVTRKPIADVTVSGSQHAVSHIALMLATEFPALSIEPVSDESALFTLN